MAAWARPALTSRHGEGNRGFGVVAGHRNATPPLFGRRGGLRRSGGLAGSACAGDGGVGPTAADGRVDRVGTTGDVAGVCGVTGAAGVFAANAAVNAAVLAWAAAKMLSICAGCHCRGDLRPARSSAACRPLR